MFVLSRYGIRAQLEPSSLQEHEYLETTASRDKLRDHSCDTLKSQKDFIENLGTSLHVFIFDQCEEKIVRLKL